VICWSGCPGWRSSWADPGDLLVGLPWLAVFLGLIVVAKSGVAYGLARLVHVPGRPVQLAVGLGQMGEFGFVLGSALVTAGVITGSLYVALLAAVVISIALSAVAVRWVKGPVPEAAPPG